MSGTGTGTSFHLPFHHGGLMYQDPIRDAEWQTASPREILRACESLDIRLRNAKLKHPDSDKDLDVPSIPFPIAGIVHVATAMEPNQRQAHAVGVPVQVESTQLGVHFEVNRTVRYSMPGNLISIRAAIQCRAFFLTQCNTRIGPLHCTIETCNERTLGLGFNIQHNAIPLLLFRFQSEPP
jgi:hypothetical protein